MVMLQSKARGTHLKQISEIRTQLRNKVEKNLSSRRKSKCRDPKVKTSLAYFRNRKEAKESGKGWVVEMWGTR